MVGDLMIGAAVCFAQPLLRRDLRASFKDFNDVDLRVAAIFLKPLMGLASSSGSPSRTR
jgi:hypothetical protein